MKKHLLKCLSLLFLTLAVQTNAQTYLYVYEPSSQKANWNYGAMSQTSGNWGVAIDTVGAIGEVVLARGANNDSLLCDTTITNNVSGKIAVIYRGACEFGLKALAAQRAGAVGCIIVNNLIGGPIGLLPGANGGSVTIPVISITHEDGIALRTLLNDGVVRAVVGNKTRLLSNDVGMYPEHVARFKHYNVPLTELANDTVLRVLPAARVRNWGSDNRTNIQLSASITHNGAAVYNQQISLPALAAATDCLLTLQAFNPFTTGAGNYVLTYTVSADGVDQFEADNTVTTRFVVGDTLYSKTPLDANGKPLISNYLNNINSPNYEYGIIFKAEKGSRLRLDEIRYAATIQSWDSLIGETVVGRLYEWDDLNQNTTMDQSELNQIGEGFYSYMQDEKGVVVNMQMDDLFTGLKGINLSDNVTYLVTLYIPGSDTVFLATYDRNVDYTLTVPTYNERCSPVFTDQWYADGFGREVSPAMALVFSKRSGTSVEETVAQNFQISLYPNPANDRILVKVNSESFLGEMQYQVVDITGRVVANGSRQAVGEADSFSLDVNSLDAGTYSLVMRTKNGFNTTRFVVVH